MTAVSAGETAIAARGVEAGYGKVAVLHDVDLQVAHGEIVALLGPNGAGKTTLMLTLAGFLSPSAGRVEFLGRPCKLAPQRRARRGLGYLGEDRHLFPSLTVAQNLRLVRHAGVAIERFPELGALSRRRAGLLSGGEQQMLGLGRALAMGATVLLIDELSLGLAPLVRERLLTMLREVADAGTAVFIVEQSVRSVLEVADRAYVLRRGRIVDHRPAADWHGQLDDLASLFLS